MKKLEDFFNLPPTEETEVEEQPPAKTKDEVLAEAKEIYSSLTTAERVDVALPTVTGLEEHDADMDSIAKRAMETFEDLISIGGNVPDMHAGKIYEVAGQMLKTAMEAKNAKTERKLKMIELQLKKVRAEQIDAEQGILPSRNDGIEFDRNKLMSYIIEAGTSKPNGGR